MPYGTTLHIFQTGIKPVWEDPALAKGSRFQLKSEKSHTSKYWEDLLLAVVGEQIGTKSQMIAGLVLNLKTQFDKIGVWFTDCEDTEEIEKIKGDILNILQIPEKELEYEVFQEISSKRPAQSHKQGKRGGFKKHNRGGRGGGNDEFGGFERAGPSTAKTAGGEDNFYRADKAKEPAAKDGDKNDE